MKTKKNKGIFLILLGAALGFFTGQEFRGAPINISDQKVLIFQSPKGGCLQAILKEIVTANYSIDILAYSFTSQELGEALIAAKKRGLKIRIVCDRSQMNGKGSKIKYLQKHIPIKVARKVKIMHNKVIIIDSRYVFTGSYNFTRNAELHNSENLIFLQNKEIAKEYQAIFDELWQNGRKILNKREEI